jgi:hypothetical protein
VIGRIVAVTFHPNGINENAAAWNEYVLCWDLLIEPPLDAVTEIRKAKQASTNFDYAYGLVGHG